MKYRVREVKLKAKRRYDCAFYESCLDYAARRYLPALPCDGCPRFKHKHPTMLDDFDGIIELLQTVFWGQGMEIFD